MYQTGCNAYRQSAYNTVEDNRVVLVKLYDGAINFIANARRGIAENSAKIRGENISKAMAIISELDCALDMEKGGQLSMQLGSLYRYIMEQLTACNLRNDLDALDQAVSILMTLKEGFETAMNQQKNSAAVPAASDSAPSAPNRRIEGVACAI